MLERIRLATEEEVAAIAAEADLTPTSRVLAMGDMRAVWRMANELDPVFYNSAPDAKKYKFIWGIENILKGSGATEYYFNVPVADEKYIQVIERLGAHRTSKEPEYRYRVNL